MDALKDHSLLVFLVFIGFAVLIHNTNKIIKRLTDILASLNRIEEKFGARLFKE